jgi:putative tricarboxylic transport membrane protein
LGLGIFSSFIGGLLSALVLIFISPPIAEFALRFGPWEYFSIGVFSLSLIASLVSGSVIKGLASTVLGLILSMIGTGPVDAARRLTFGFNAMDAGLDLLPVMVGLFAVSELFTTAATVYQGDIKPIHFAMKGLGFSLREYWRQKINILRSTLIGAGIGILPGIGGSTSNILSYLAAKNQSKYPEKFGTGISDGIVASEAANNATIGGALIPLMTMGIPGDGVTSLLLGGLLLHGISPGPLLFVNQWQFVYAIFGAVLVANVFMLVCMYGGIRPVAKILRIPKYILLPIIMALCAVGAYSLNNRVFDVGTMLVLGIIGYLLEKAGFSLTPIVLGFVLGPIVELNLRRGLMSSHNSFLPILKSPISLIFLSIAVISIVGSFLKEVYRNRVKVKS